MPFKIVRNDLTKMKVDAIVNTANPNVGYGAGTDEAVYNAAGIDKLLEARKAIGNIAPGEAYITPGFNLNAGYIIHTVGPVWQGGNSGEKETLKMCYINSLKLAAEYGFESVAFPLISSGTYGFPKKEALDIPLTVFFNFLDDNDMDIYLVVYDRESVRISEHFFANIDNYIDDNYVDEAAVFSKNQRDMRIPMHNSGAFGAAPTAPSMMQPLCIPVDMQALKSEPKPVPKPEPSPEPKPKSARKFGFLTRDRIYEADECEKSACEENIEVSGYEDFIREETRSLDDVIMNLQKTFMEMVFSFADERGMTDLEVRKRANLDKKTFSKLKCGNTKNPSKATALAIAVALRLNLDETKDLLARAGMALSPCSKFDLIVQYFIEQGIYDIYIINIALFEHDEQLLGSQAID